MRVTSTILLIALAIWLSVIVAAGAAAIANFSTLPKLEISVQGTEAFFASNSEEMGKFAAGRALQPLFMASDWVQFAVSSIVVGCTLRLARLGDLHGPKWARVALMTSVVAAATLLAFRAWTAPSMNADLSIYWAGVMANDHAIADEARAQFDIAHRTADAVFKMQGIAVLGALISLLPALLQPATAHAAKDRATHSIGTRRG